MLIGAVFTTATQLLVLEFDQAMDQTSLPVSNGNLVEWNVAATNHRGRLPLSWLDATHLQLTTGSLAAVVPADTTRCLNTGGIRAAGAGLQAQSWDLFPLTVVP